MASNMDWDMADAALHSSSSPSRQQAPRDAARAPRGPQSSSGSTRYTERDRQLALFHATLIQQRKDMEAQILKSTIALIDYPTNKPDADPAKPIEEDITAVKQHLRLFQPSDYDALVQERNIEKQCGYVLCPRPYRPDTHTGKWAIILRKGDLQVVETKDLMRWCCDDCAKRAMFIRVQISETPAWERQEDAKLQLLGEEEGQEDTPQAQAVAKMTSDLKKLALERGNPTADKLMSDVMERNVPNG